TIEGGVHLFVDVDGFSLVPVGATMLERPTVVLLHGGPGLDHTLYKGPDALTLDDVAQVICYDHRGNGRSDWGSPEDWALDTWADDVVRLCDALGVVRPVVVGASFGGFVAQRYLARHPDHPSKVALLCTTPRLDLDAIERRFTELGGEIAGRSAKKFFGGDMSVLADFLEHCIPLYSTEPQDPDVFARTIMNFDLMSHFFSGEAASMDLRSGLAAASCPVLVIGGELDPVMPMEITQELVAALPTKLMRFELLPGVSHLQVGGRGSTALLRDFVLK
ncbi:MAG TPA: alpha/beta hydrolase, partial [Acidimicrobiales bacterium]